VASNETIRKGRGRAKAVLDGEIVILDDEGRPQFYDLFRPARAGDPVFHAFNLLWLDGDDLRARTLIEAQAAVAAHRAGVTIGPVVRRPHRAERSGVVPAHLRAGPGGNRR
jgi:ATP-dependent DNA ligase